jgi:hypothetical protein
VIGTGKNGEIGKELAHLNIGELTSEEQHSVAMLIMNNGTIADVIRALIKITHADSKSKLAWFIKENGTSEHVDAAVRALPNVTHPDAAFALAWFIKENGTKGDVPAAVRALPNVTHPDAAFGLAWFIRENGTKGDVPAAIKALSNITHLDAASELAWLIRENGTRKTVKSVNTLLGQTDIELPTRVRQTLESFVANANRQTENTINPDSGRKSVPPMLRQKPPTSRTPGGTRVRT